jgi:hypothetical protein
MTTPTPAAAHADTETKTGGLHPGGEMAAGIMTTAAGEVNEAGAITRPDRRPLPGGTAETATAGGHTMEGTPIVQAANQDRAETGKIATADMDRAPRGQPMARGTGGGAGIQDDTKAGSSHAYVTTAIDTSPGTGTKVGRGRTTAVTAATGSRVPARSEAKIPTAMSDQREGAPTPALGTMDCGMPKTRRRGTSAGVQAYPLTVSYRSTHSRTQNTSRDPKIKSHNWQKKNI